MLKKVAIGVGIVAALLLLAGVAAALLVDVNSYKPTIERRVAETTGRKLTIDGPLSMRVFPRLGVALPRSTLSEQGGDRRRGDREVDAAQDGRVPVPAGDAAEL